ncbi:MAG: TonB-dependent receptor, partial [Sphingomicrobium sp.]
MNASRALRAGASTLVLGAMIWSPAAYAQDAAATTQEQADATLPLAAQTDPDSASTPKDEPGAIIVTGQRRALRNAQQIKRNADTVVDSITATDIGAFPDKSIAEALQRVPGVTVNRFAATGDTAHFSAEPSGVIVRGLPQVRSEFNGRDTFSANSGRGLSWSDVTPELMAGVDTYKNQTAELIEGGIAGSINLRTRVPFDATGQLFQVGANMNYNDLAKKWTPDGNVFYSNRWNTGIGEIGIMGNAALSKVTTASQGIQYGRVGIFDGVTQGGFADAPTWAYAPVSAAWRDNTYHRTRTGIAAAAQWKSLDDRLLLTTQYNRSVYKSHWAERAFSTTFFDIYGKDVRYRITPGLYAATPYPTQAPGSDPFTFNDDGFISGGSFNRYAEWYGVPGGDVGFGTNDQGQPMFNTCYVWGCPNGGEVQRSGNIVGTASRFNENKNMTQDISANLKWEATDRLRFNFDAQHVNATVHNYDIEVDMNSFANVNAEFVGHPSVELLPPTMVNQSAGGLSNPNNWYINSVMDHLEESKGHENAFRADGEYDISTDWLDSVKFGGRYADRVQKVQWSTYNWHNIANTWTNFTDTSGNPCPHPYFNLDSPAGGSCPNPAVSFNGYPSGFYEVSSFGNSFHGGTIGDFAFVPNGFLRDHRADEFSADVIGAGGFIPICERNGQVTPGGDVLPVELDGSCFAPDEIADVSEKTNALYAMLKFGGDNARIGGMSVQGNIGLRYVTTKNESTGFLRYPTRQGDPDECPATPLVPGGLTGTGEPAEPPEEAPPGTVVFPAFPSFCYLTGEDLAFASGGGDESTVKVKHTHWLPSFNLRLNLTPKWLLRFAASKAMSRPDIGLMKNFVSISQSLPGGNPTDEGWILGPNGEAVGIDPSVIYSASAYNPYLKPTTAWQYDLSLENYFANVGSFSFALFYKKFSNYIQYGTFNQNVTRNGVTRNVEVRGPANGKGAKISGFEVAYTRYFDFLPDPLNGLGIQTNFTYVKNKGVPNSNLTPVGSNGQTTNAGTAGSALNPGSLEGLSKYAYNIVGMYEKNGLNLRLA